jgi:glutamate-ammonia-ligase adenylyltransferase
MNLQTNAPMGLWPQHSEFAKRWINRYPEWDEASAEQPLHDLIAAWAQAIPRNLDEHALMAALRQLRQRSMLHIMKRDLLQQASLFEITEAFSLLAHTTVQIALDFSHQAQAERFGEPAHHDCLMVVGMGKLGGFELNASSDIDLVYIYNREGETLGGPGGKSQSHAEFFAQVGRRVNKIIAEVTEDGFVFRVDMRLRPNGDAGPLAVTLDMLEEYFIVQGREWERYAWIKARVINAPPSPAHSQAFDKAVEDLHNIIRPFVYRKYLDFGTISALRTLHAQIRAEAQKQDRLYPNSIHVKLGRGGIREIEFSAQVFQLIRGGRESSLQTRRTLAVLEQCQALQLISADELKTISAAYIFLRNVEHRLQYVDDAQTHRLSNNPLEQERIALSMGFSTKEAFLTTLKQHMDFVSAHFDAVLGERQDEEESTELSLPWEPHLTENFRHPEAAQARYQALIESGRYLTLPEAHRTRVNRLMPALLNAASTSRAPDSCWRYCCELVDAIAKRGAYLSLLDEYPAARQRVCRLLAASPWAAHFLIKHPILLDELLDPRTLLAPPNLPQWKTQVHQALEQARNPDGTPDLERQMDLIREQHHAQQFRVLSQDLEQLLSVEQVSDLLSELADCTLEVVLDMAWQQIPKRHLDHPRFAVIAYGKHGGKELGYASDLDLIFLFDDPDENAHELYANLAKRFNRWLSTQTAAGILFETDFRLRPNGESGLLVSTVDSFAAYQRRQGGNGAWFWEHQALTRARFCVGDPDIGRQFESLREEILRQQRQWPEVQQEVLRMRHKMQKTHSSPPGLFDIKLDSGGMVDVEFMVQALILGYAHQHPNLTKNMGNIALLKQAGELGLAPQELANEVANAYRQLRAKQHTLRLAGQDNSLTDIQTITSLRTPVLTLWNYLLKPIVP